MKKLGIIILIFMLIMSGCTSINNSNQSVEANEVEVSEVVEEEEITIIGEKNKFTENFSFEEEGHKIFDVLEIENEVLDSENHIIAPISSNLAHVRIDKLFIDTPLKDIGLSVSETGKNSIKYDYEIWYGKDRNDTPFFIVLDNNINPYDLEIFLLEKYNGIKTKPRPEDEYSAISIYIGDDKLNGILDVMQKDYIGLKPNYLTLVERENYTYFELQNTKQEDTLQIIEDLKSYYNQEGILISEEKHWILDGNIGDAKNEFIMFIPYINKKERTLVYIIKENRMVNATKAGMLLGEDDAKINTILDVRFQIDEKQSTLNFLSLESESSLTQLYETYLPESFKIEEIDVNDETGQRNITGLYTDDTGKAVKFSIVINRGFPDATAELIDFTKVSFRIELQND